MRVSLPLAWLLIPAVSFGADWPQWRGPDRDGVCKETGLLKKWPANGPAQIWQKDKLGKGYASVAIAGRKLYTMADRGKEAFVVCLNLDGEENWATPIGRAWNDGGSALHPHRRQRHGLRAHRPRRTRGALHRREARVAEGLRQGLRRADDDRLGLLRIADARRRHLDRHARQQQRRGGRRSTPPPAKPSGRRKSPTAAAPGTPAWRSARWAA